MRRDLHQWCAPACTSVQTLHRPVQQLRTTGATIAAQQSDTLTHIALAFLEQRHSLPKRQPFQLLA